MGPKIFKIVSQVAGVAGISLAVFLSLFRDVIRKKIFPKLTKKQAFRLLTLLLVLVWSIALAGIGAWVWVSLDKDLINPPITPIQEETNLNEKDPSISSKMDPNAKLVGEWIVTSKGNLPETVTQELENATGTDSGSPKAKPGNEMLEAIADLGRSVRDLAKTASGTGSFKLRLNKDTTYRLSEKSGIFQNPVYEKLGPSGTWTFNPKDNRLVLISEGENKAYKIELKTIEGDRLPGEGFGGRTCEFTRKQ
jgi:hypothetical protein